MADVLRDGVLDIEEDMGAIVRARGMVEKPAKGSAPSNLAVIGRYILAPEVMGNLNKLRQGAGGEIQLTDAIADEIAEVAWPLAAEGRLKPVIHARFALAQAAEAHALMESGDHVGKIVLTVTREA